MLDRLRTLRIPSFVAAMLLLLGVGAVSVSGIAAHSRSVDSVRHTYEVLGLIDDVEASTRAAESAARAFRLTAQPAQQAEYLAAADRARSEAAALVAFVSDNAAQTGRARALNTHVAERLAEIDRLVRVQNEHGAERARSATLGSRGVELMHRVSRAAEAMYRAENALLRARTASFEQRTRRLTTFVVIGTLLPMLMLGLLMAGLSFENRRVRELERTRRRAMAELEASVAQRDRISEQRRDLAAYSGLLQSCQTLNEATMLTGNVLGELLPEAGGRCYVLRASQNMAETVAEFGHARLGSAGLLQPDDCWALRRGQPHYCAPGHSSLRCPHVDPAGPEDSWSLCVPMGAHGMALGMLHLNGRAEDGGNAGDVHVVETIAEQLSQAMANLQLRETLRLQSLRDSLTGLYNRRYLEENLQRELQRCARRELPLAVMMLDVDHFKRFNDTHGHAAGDAVLAKVGELLSTMTRGEDMVCRYGGEEFTLVLPEADPANALRRAEEIRAAVAAIQVVHLRQMLGPVSASIGLACFPADGATGDQLLAAADAALYRAKSEGRNRVVASG